MNDKFILDILDILEQIVNTCKLLSQEVYSSLDYSNSTIDICANKFQELEFKVWELQEVYKNDRKSTCAGDSSLYMDGDGDDGRSSELRGRSNSVD